MKYRMRELVPRKSKLHLNIKDLLVLNYLFTPEHEVKIYKSRFKQFSNNRLAFDLLNVTNVCNYTSGINTPVPC